MGDAKHLFVFFEWLGSAFVGDVCPAEPLGAIPDESEARHTLRVVAVEEAA